MRVQSRASKTLVRGQLRNDDQLLPTGGIANHVVPTGMYGPL